MRKEKIYIHVLLTFSLGVSGLSAQAPYSLADCKQLAIENNRKIKNSRLEIDAAEQTKKEAFTNFFPSVNASGFGFKAKDPMVAMQMGEMPIALLDDGLTGAVTLTQPVFVGGKIIHGNKLAIIGTEISRFQAKLSENEVLLTTEGLYWQLVSLLEKGKTLDIIDNQLDTLLKDVEVSYKAGLIMRNDVLKVQLKKNEVKSNRINLENGIKLVKMSLCQQMGLEMGASDHFEIARPAIEHAESPVLYYVDHQEALSGRMEAKLLDKNVEASVLQTRMKQGDYLPTVAVGATYYQENFLNRWNGNGAVFVSVNIPLSGWWGGSHAIKNQRIKERIAYNRKVDAEEQLLLQMQKVKNELDDAYKQIMLANEAVEQSNENFRLNTDYYKAGTVTLTDMLDAQTLLQQSRDKYVETYCNYEKKIFEYQQVTGR